MYKLIKIKKKNFEKILKTNISEKYEKLLELK